MIIRIPFTNIFTNSEVTSHNTTVQGVSSIIGNRMKTIKVSSSDWTGDTTGYRNADEYGNAQCYYADVEHNMINSFVFCIGGKGATDFIDVTIIDQKTIDGNTTRVWIRKDSAPSYDVLFLFVAG